MLETIRQFAEEQLAATRCRRRYGTPTLAYFAGREADIMALWDSPRQREAYDWFIVELANLRAAFRWAADHNDLDVAIAVAYCAYFFGLWVEQYEPIAWVEELIGEARAVGHRRLTQLYVAAAQCHTAGRVDDAVEYLEASQQIANGEGFDPVPYEAQSSTGIVYSHAGQPERWVELCRREIAGGIGPHTITRASLVMAFYFLGDSDEARAACEGLLAAADATDNPATACFALLAHGLAYLNADPVAAYDALRRGLKVARDSGNRQMESAMAAVLCQLAASAGDLVFGATRGDPIDAFDYLTVTIRRYHDSGNLANLHNPLVILAAVFDRLGRYEPAATIAGFAIDPFTSAAFPEITTAIAHLRDVLGEQTYEQLARKGETMTTAAMATYAYDQIDQARTELEHPS